MPGLADRHRAWSHRDARLHRPERHSLVHNCQTGPLTPCKTSREVEIVSAYRGSWRAAPAVRFMIGGSQVRSPYA
jgi:hypothetical protein